MTAEAPVPVGRLRRYSGYVCYGYGFPLCLWIAWLTYRHHPAFREADWLRSTVLFWFGLELVLLGCWLVFRSRWAIMAAVAVMILFWVVATISPFPTEPLEIDFTS